MRSGFFTEPGDGVIIQRPVYRSCSTKVEELGRNVLNNQLIRHTDQDECGDLYYTMDFDGLEGLARRDDAKLMICAIPTTPWVAFGAWTSLFAWRISARATG